ncbi:short-chain dehydrogenase [Bacillus massilinigeriensis]|uniref:short-chain dehydrogenase n=1 Tax=Bacillus mediterraneensis TaxID=1805474 RepID=UPI0008F90602|nr:short-chain dehydrogenase [Bacillus mediterraneensis]
MKHAFVIGGTGMLADVSLWLVESGYKVSVLARNSEKMQRLIDAAPNKDNVIPVLVDYENDRELRESLESLMTEHGSVDLVVAWVHAVAPQALPSVIDVVKKAGSKLDLYHVLGSSQNLSKVRQSLHLNENCRYHQIQLGFILEGNRSRWLTNEEIAAGVIQGVLEKKKIHVVGQLEPKERMP